MMSPSSARRALAGLAVTGAMAAVPLLTALPVWVFAALAGGLAWRYAHERRGLYLPGRPGRFLLLLIVLIATYRQYGTLLGRDPGLALLIALLGLKCLELRTRRDYMLCVFLSYLMLLGAFLHEQTIWVGLWAVLTVLVSLAALMRMAQPSGLDTAAALRLAAGLMLRAAPLMLIFYLLFPRFPGPLWGLPAPAGAAITGVPEVVQPGSIHHLSTSDAIAFRVRFDGPRPAARDLYWRVLVMTRTDGRQWMRDIGGLGDASFTAHGAPVRYTVTLEPSRHPWMPALELPASAPGGARLTEVLTLEHGAPIRERLTYPLVSYTRYRTGALSPAEREAALALPRQIDPRVRELAQRWRRDNAEAWAIAAAALAYFRNEPFVYTLIPPLGGADPLAEFLFETRRGYCEHYAAAFVTLMRAAGVPARLVVGYQGGEYNAAGNYLVVRQSDAHAWAEIWSPAHGWLRIDPTAAVAPQRIELGMEALRRLAAQGFAFGDLPDSVLARALRLGWFGQLSRRVYWYWDYANFAWHRWVIDYGAERQRRLLARLGIDRFAYVGQAAAMAAGAAALLLAYGLFTRRGTTRRRDPVQHAYLRFCRKLARTGVTRAPHEGPLAFAARAAQRHPQRKAAIDGITALYVELRYGKGAVKDMLPRLERQIAAFKP